MRKTFICILLAGLLLGTHLSGCDLLDPTNAENPNILEDTFLDFADPLGNWLNGMERQMALALNRGAGTADSGYIVAAEIASDNYENTQTFFNQFMDNLSFDITDDDIEEVLNSFADLRETAEFGLNRVVPVDEDATDNQIAELWFYKGMAHLLTGEVFHLAPADSAGPVVTSDVQFNQAVEAFNQALSLTPDVENEVGYRIALARTYRNLRDAANARSQAEQALAARPQYLRFAGYDFTNGPNNDVQTALYDRGTFDDLQPLPRLDFLDPKFFQGASPNGGDDEESDLAYLKAEEAYLIIAEVQLAQGDLAGAQATLNDLLNVVNQRRQTRLVDAQEGRTNDAPGSRPNTAGWSVAASPDDPMREGLVLERAAEVMIPVISGTSITADDVNALSDVDAALELLYLMRQEIFIAEGRRMMDLGIKWPVPEPEIIANPNINADDPATLPQVPGFLPPGNELDAFTLNAETQEAVIMHNLNRILVQNKTSDLVLPFF